MRTVVFILGLVLATRGSTGARLSAVRSAASARAAVTCDPRCPVEGTCAASTCPGDPPGTSITTFATGLTTPMGIVFDGTNFLVAERDSGELTVLNGTTGAEIRSVTALVGVKDVAWNGTAAYSSSTDGVRYRHQASDSAVTNSVWLGYVSAGDIVAESDYIYTAQSWSSTPNGQRRSAVDLTATGVTYTTGVQTFAAVKVGANLWLAGGAPGTAVKFDAATGTIIGSYSFPGNGPQFLGGIVYDGTFIWVTSDGGSLDTVTKIQETSGTVIGTFTIGAGVGGDVAFDGKNIWATNFTDNTVSVLRASDGAAIGTFATGAAPAGLLYSAGFMYITNSNAGSITKINTR